MQRITRNTRNAPLKITYYLVWFYTIILFSFALQNHQLTVDDNYFENTVAMNKMLVQKNFGMLRHPVNNDL